MGDGRGDENTAEVKGDSPGGTAGRQRSLWLQNTSADLPVQRLTKHPTQYTHRSLLPTDIICQCVTVLEYSEVATL